MLSSLSIETWGIWVLFGTFLALETMLLPSLVATWLFQLIVDAFPSEKAAGSFKEGSFLEESLLIVILKIIGILGLELTLFSLLSSEKDESLREMVP